MKDTWIWFKELVIEVRKWNSDLISEIGSNSVMLGITLYDKEIKDWIDLNPHSINLKTGKTTTKINGKYREINIKWLLFHKKLEFPR